MRSSIEQTALQPQVRVGPVPLLGLSILLQVACVVHAIRTGRSQLWIYVIIFLPGAGCLAYLVAELLPDLFGSRAARDLTKSARRMVDPEADLRRYADDLALADTTENRRNYAAALMLHGRSEEAIQILEQAMTGIHQDDTGLML